MINYPLNINRERTHTIEIKFQIKEYKGRLSFKTRENFRGFEILNILDNSSEWLHEKEDLDVVTNDCNFGYIYEHDIYTLDLKNAKGEVCTFDFDITDIQDYIVGVKIIDCEIAR